MPVVIDISRSRRIAALLGPTIMAIVAAEFPLVQPGLYASQTPVVIYLSGTLFLVAGLAIVQAHNLWVRDWRVLVTLCGWMILVLGLARMFTATRYQQLTGTASTAPFMIIEGVLFVVGAFLAFQGLRRSG
jgi:hypothetical protein